MLRPVLAGFLVLSPAIAWAQQNQPIPDTGPAKTRHREREKEPPPLEGPWGPEEFGLTWLTPVWRGVFADAQTYSGDHVELNLPRGITGGSDMVSRSFLEELDWKSQNFRTLGGRAMVDLDMVRLSLLYFGGSFDARARMTLNNSVDPPTTTDVNLYGTAYGFRFGAYWPALRYRDSALEASLGPIVTVGWLHEEADAPPVAPLPFRDSKDILTGSLGPELSLRAMFGRVAVELDGEYSFQTGGARGWVRAFLLGVGYHF